MTNVQGLPPGILVRRPELLRAGHTADDIQSDVRAGRLDRIYRGSYLRTSEPEAAQRPFQVQARITAIASRSPGLVVSHTSAAILHMLPLIAADLDTVCLIRPGSTGAGRRTGKHVRAARISDDEIVSVDGIRTTTVSRTLLDLACTASPRTAIAAADEAVRRGLVTPSALAAATAQAGPRTGIARARRFLGFVDGRAESPGESALRWAMAEAGLDAPELQVVVRSRAGGFLARVDLAYLEDAVLIEFDGKIKYTALLKSGQSATDVILAEKRREESLTEAGFVVVRVVWDELADPAALARRIRAAQVRGRRSMAAGLVTGSLHACEPIAVV